MSYKSIINAVAVVVAVMFVGCGGDGNPGNGGGGGLVGDWLFVGQSYYIDGEEIQGYGGGAPEGTVIFSFEASGVLRVTGSDEDGQYMSEESEYHVTGNTVCSDFFVDLGFEEVCMDYSISGNGNKLNLSMSYELAGSIITSTMKFDRTDRAK